MVESKLIRSSEHAYQILSPLGAGGQGKTFLVEREGEPGSRYVLKQLRMELIDDWKQVELFEREVGALAELEHPGIPRLVDRIEEEGRSAGLVQTQVPGRTVAAWIQDTAPLSPERFEQILRQSLEILAYLQERVPPLMHRDINPRNLMVDEARTYLVDFGAVRVGGRSDMTSVGTFGYMAPEQIIGRPEPASDVFGLGMTLICLAERLDVGELPIDGASGQIDTKLLLRDVEPRVREVLLAMIEPGLEARIARAKEALRRLDAAPSVMAEALAPVVPAPARPPATGLLAAGVLGAVLLVGAGVFMAMLGSSADAPEPPAPAVVAPEPPSAPPVPAAPSAPPTAEAPPAPPAVEAPPAPPSAPVPVELGPDNSAELTVVTDPAGLQVTIDGLAQCTAPCASRVGFGKHRVHVEHEGRRVERQVNVLEDMRVDIAVTQP